MSIVTFKLLLIISIVVSMSSQDVYTPSLMPTGSPLTPVQFITVDDFLNPTLAPTKKPSFTPTRNPTNIPSAINLTSIQPISTQVPTAFFTNGPKTSQPNLKTNENPTTEDISTPSVISPVTESFPPSFAPSSSSESVASFITGTSLSQTAWIGIFAAAFVILLFCVFFLCIMYDRTHKKKNNDGIAAWVTARDSRSNIQQFKKSSATDEGSQIHYPNPSLRSTRESDIISSSRSNGNTNANGSLRDSRGLQHSPPTRPPPPPPRIKSSRSDISGINDQHSVHSTNAINSDCMNATIKKESLEGFMPIV